MRFGRGASRSAAPDDVTATGASLGLGAVLRLPLPQLDPRPRLFLIGQGRRNRNFAEIGHHGWRVALLPEQKSALPSQEPLGNAPRRFCPNPLPYGKLKKSSA